MWFVSTYLFTILFLWPFRASYMRKVLHYVKDRTATPRCFFNVILIVTSRLEGYAETNFILDQEQEGFRHFRSTDNALLSLVKSVFNAFNKGESALIIFIDLEKTCDSIWR